MNGFIIPQIKQRMKKEEIIRILKLIESYKEFNPNSSNSEAIRESLALYKYENNCNISVKEFNVLKRKI